MIKNNLVQLGLLDLTICVFEISGDLTILKKTLSVLIQ